jgi:hypothetical protein
MKHFTFLATACLSLWVAGSATAQQVVESYVAYIGREDLFNSQGVRLTEPWQILRQDRANYHRFGIAQRGDQWDSFFAGTENRAIMERMVMNGYIDPVAARNIVNGGATILVEIFGRGSRGDYVNITVLR